MHADHNRDGERLVAPLQFVVQSPEMATDGHENAQLAFARHHQPVIAGVSDAAVGIGSDDDTRGDIRRRVHVIVSEQRHCRQIHIDAELGNFVDRRVGDFHRRDRFTLALGELDGELFRFTL